MRAYRCVLSGASEMRVIAIYNGRASLHFRYFIATRTIGRNTKPREIKPARGKLTRAKSATRTLGTLLIRRGPLYEIIFVRGLDVSLSPRRFPLSAGYRGFNDNHR